MILLLVGLVIGVVLGVVLTFLWALGKAAQMEDWWIRNYGG